MATKKPKQSNWRDWDMVPVDSIINITKEHMSMDYDAAHDIMEEHVNAQDGSLSSGGKVVLKFEADPPSVHYDFLYAIAECVQTNEHILWHLNHSAPPVVVEVMEHFGVNVHPLEEPDVVYVPRRAKRY